MKRPAFGDGGGHEGGGEPRVPYQRDQGGTPDDEPRRPPYDPPPSADPSPSPSPSPNPYERAHDKPQEAPYDPSLEASVPGRPPRYDHHTLKSLLGAWALAVCSRDESLAVEVHLTDCAPCAEEALRLRDAVGLLHQEESLDLDPLLRARVLEGCLGRRPARIPVPEWAGPYDAEAARLDALLRDLGDSYWTAPVEMRWFDGAPVSRRFSLRQVIAHLTAVDSLPGRALGLPSPGAGPAARSVRPGRGRSGGPQVGPGLPVDPWERTAAHWEECGRLPGAELRSRWREQTHSLVRTVSFAGGGVAGLTVEYGKFTLPLRDSFVDRAFECWIHAGDIAEAVDYPYEPPAAHSLNLMIDLAARLLPDALADRRRAGLTTSTSRLVAAGAPGRSLLLEIEGAGGGKWYLPLDSPGAVASADETVAHVAMDGVEFCQLAAGRIEPERIAAGQLGDRAVIRDVLYATASLSRL